MNWDLVEEIGRYTWLYRRFGVSDAGRNMEDVVKTPDSKTNTGVSKI